MKIKNIGNISDAINELKNDKNNAVSFIYENAKIHDGLLSGATFTIKDIFATEDAPTQASSKILENFMPYYDAEVVARLRKAGATFVGKTHLDELALGGTGTYSAYGIIKNPLDKTRIIGGSSSGAAATFSKNISIALGSDTGDSVRLPASYTGHFGFKPSYGAISRFGLFAFATSLDTVGFFAHNVNDLIVTSNVLFGEDEKDFSSRTVDLPTIEEIKPKRVAMLSNTELLSKKIKDDYAHLKETLSKEGVEINEYKLDTKLLEAINTCYMIISFSEASSNNANLNGIAFGNSISGKTWVDQMTSTRSKGFGRMVQRRFALGAFYLQKENQDIYFNKAKQVRRMIVDMFNKLYSENDLLIFPSAPIAPLLSEGKEDNWFSSYLTHANLSGNPSLSIPWVSEGDMPVNLTLDAKLYNDKSLLSYALWFERLFGGKNV